MLYRLFMGGFRRVLLPSIVKREIQNERRYEETIVVKNFPEGSTEPLTAAEIEQVRTAWGGRKQF